MITAIIAGLLGLTGGAIIGHSLTSRQRAHNQRTRKQLISAWTQLNAQRRIIDDLRAQNKRLLDEIPVASALAAAGYPKHQPEHICQN